MTTTKSAATENDRPSDRTPGPRWWESPFRMFQTNLREPDAALDVQATLDYIERHGADVWLLNAGGISSFYPTALDFQTRNRFLADRPSGDLVGDAVEAAHARGIRLMARMDFSKVATEIADRHPDWWFVDPHGERQTYQGLTSMCPLGAYYQHRAFEVIDEVVERYPVDGFFFNWFSFNEVDYSYRYRGVCHCAACQERFAAFSGGEPLPSGPDDDGYQRWLEFSALELTALSAAFREHVARVAPGAGLILGRAADIVFHEANNALGREFWPFSTGEAVSGYTTRAAPQPVLVNAVSFVDMPYRLAGEQPEHFALYLLQTIARGANPSTYIMGAPGDVRYPSLEPAGEITRFHRDNADLYDGLLQAGAMALVHPDRLRLERGPLEAATEEYRGLYSALQELHVPFDVLSMAGMREAAASPARYRAIILPDLGELEPEEAALLDAYTRAGGTVVCTGSSALGADGAPQLATSAATALTETIAEPESLRNTYVGDVGGDEDVALAQSASLVPSLGAVRRFTWHTDAIPHWRQIGPAPYGPPERTWGHSVTEHPGWARRPVGEGASIVVALTLGRSYRESALTVSRDAIDAVLHGIDLGGERLETAEQIEMIRGRSHGRTVLHLINTTGVRRRGVGAGVPVRGARLHLDRIPARVRSRVAGVDLDVVADGRGATVTLPDIGMFDVVVIDEEGPSA